jgi:hypothetical protein
MDSRTRINIYLYNFFLYHHHHHPRIALSGVGTTCYLLPFSSINRHLHAHSFYSHVIFHTVHPYFLSIYIHIIHRNTQTQYKQACPCTQMFAMCGNRTRDLLCSSEYSHHYAKSAVKYVTVICLRQQRRFLRGVGSVRRNRVCP